MGIPKPKQTATIYDVRAWYDKHQAAQDRPTPALMHAHKALMFQYEEAKLMDRGYCACCHQYVPEWEKPKLPF